MKGGKYVIPDDQCWLKCAFQYKSACVPSQHYASTATCVPDLNWGKLEQRRKRSDVTLMHKVVYHLIAVPVYHHPTMAEITSTRHSHAWKFQTIRTNIYIYKYSFFPRTTILWNQLPTACDSHPGLGRIQGGSQGSILNFHIHVQCKYVVSFKL